MSDSLPTRLLRKGVQHQRLFAILDAAQRLAVSDLSDDEAVAQLKPVLEGVRTKATGDALHVAKTRRGDYVGDREFRLLSAVVNEVPPEPISTHLRELFGEEERLGRLPIQQAFSEFAQLEPRLSGLGEGPASGSVTSADHKSYELREPYKTLYSLVGPDQHTNTRSLLRSDLARSLLRTYLETTEGRPGSLDNSFFEQYRDYRTISSTVSWERGRPIKTTEHL